MASPTAQHRPPANSKDLLHQAKRLMSSPAYYQSGHVDHEKAHETVVRIYQTVYGTGPVHDPAIASAGPRPRGDD
jgi:hypothetical protein